MRHSSLGSSSADAPDAQFGSGGFAQAIDAAVGSGISVVDVAGRAIHVNDAFCRMVGWSRQELLGAQAPFPYWPEDQRPAIDAAFQLTLAGRFPVEGQTLVFRRRDGARFPALLYVAPLREGGRVRGWVANVVDLSAQGAQPEALRASGAKWEAMLNALPDLMFVVERDGLLLEFHSGALEQLYLPPAAFLGKRIADVLPAEASRVIMAALEEAAVRGASVSAVYPLPMPDGTRWFEASVAAMRGSPEAPLRFIALARDVTLRKAAEEALSRARVEAARFESERRLGALLGQSLAGVVETTLDGRILAANDRYCALTGHSREELLQRTWRDLTPPEDHPLIDSAMRSLLQAEPVGTPVLRHLRKGGGLAWVLCAPALLCDDQGRPERICAIALDITASKEQELALADAQRRWQFALEGAAHGVWDWDVARGKAYHSAQYKRMLGYAEHENFDEDAAVAFARCHPHDLPKVEAALHRCLRGEAPDFRFEFRTRCKDGHYIWTESRGMVVERAADGTATRMIGTQVDITARKRDEEALRALTQNLEWQVAERTAQLTAAAAAKSEFLAHMSHEIRTPMNAVVNIAQLLQAEPLTPAQQGLVHTISEAGQSLLRIINDILDFSRIEAGQLPIERRPFELDALLDRVDSLLRGGAIAKGLRFAIASPPGGWPRLRGDALRLEQVLVNLIANAVKFTERGEITLTVVKRAETAEGVRLRFEVRDTGVGIAADAKAALFQPFTQADSGITRRFGGTGLGLAICKRLVDLMGGEIAVASTPGEGSTFWFELPFAWVGEQTGGDAPREAPGSDGPRLAGLRVLAVDDSQTNLIIVEGILKREGATTVFAADGQQALQLLQVDPQAFDVVLMDIQMPVMDGLTATRAIRSDPALARLPVIALTAGVMPEERDRALSAGVDDFLPKPLDRGLMVDMLGSVRAARARKA